MRRRRILTAVLCACLLAAPSLLAQPEQGNLAWVEFQKAKPGKAQQYEEGRKAKAAWHQQQNDPWPLLVWQVMSGDHTGSYVVGLFGRFWKDFDAPPGGEEAGEAEFEKSIGPYTESVVTRFYANLPEVSRYEAGKEPAAMSTVVTFKVRFGKEEEFRHILSQFHEAAEATEWPVKYQWYQLVNGGHHPTFVVSYPRETWADFAASAQSPMEILEKALGAEAARAVAELGDAIIEGQESAILRFRRDLSYLPAE